MVSTQILSPALPRDCAGKVLVVDDEHDLRTIVRMFLEKSGYAVAEAMDGRSALRALHDWRPDIVILDILMPDLDGWMVLERIRDVADVPVLVLSALATEMDKVRGLQAGADDFVTKPFGRQEVLARVRALMRRAAVATYEPSVYKDGLLTIDFQQGLVSIDPGGELRLTPTEFRLLSELVRSAGEIVSQDRLLQAVWRDSSGLYRDQVKLRISGLRRKLGQSAGASSIETVRGFGYRYRQS